MRNKLFLIFFFVIIFFSKSYPVEFDIIEGDFQFNRILIEMEDINSKNKIEKVFNFLGIKDITPNSLNKIRRGIITSAIPFQFIKKKLLEYDCIECVEPDSVYRIESIPCDPLFNVQWNLHNTGQTNGKRDADIDAPEAWDIETGKNEIIIAVIDTGIDYTHNDLKNNIWVNEKEIPENNIDDDNNGYVDDISGWDFHNWDNDPMDDYKPYYHGTHVAGILGAIGDNGNGVAGVSWKVSVMPLKSFSKYGYGFTSDIVPAVYYAIDNGAKIINASWGSIFYSESIHKAISYAESKGVVFIAAAGNWGFDIDRMKKYKIRGIKLGYYPAGYDLSNIISVAASDHKDKFAWFSNYGKESVDVAAPGVGIISTMKYNKYGYLNGTSMAAPHVAGAVCLVYAKNEDFVYQDVVKTICSSVDLIHGYELRTCSGGRLNLYKCLTKVPKKKIPDYVWKYVYYYISKMNQ